MSELFNYILFFMDVDGMKTTKVHLPLSYAQKLHEEPTDSSIEGIFGYLFKLFPPHVDKIIFENDFMTLSASREDILKQIK